MAALPLACAPLGFAASLGFACEVLLAHVELYFRRNGIGTFNRYTGAQGDGDGRFQPVDVTPGITQSELTEIISGIDVGDEVVVSGQFLIDSESSIAGSINRLETVDSLPEQRALGQVFASGWVDEVDLEHRRIRVSHGPIDALGWPGMTMKFNVTESVELARIHPGQNVHFSISPDRQGVYRVDMVHLVDSDDQKVETRPAEQDHD